MELIEEKSKREQRNQIVGEDMDEVPQTPTLKSNANIQNDDIEDVMSWEEKLVEARIIWDVGKTV